ncbi:NAD(P)-binding protein [Ceraceosorus guamensis]|uniref:NAD(P)-binding protein n=1 Tax=Ceraceosorus guamensis TaxID=1522189 RepID=A0A316W854_9BASI|nr:NAD(P)-binding protein [Ceraceosorus guamensis]PWN46012.1 NAD(P)-binding protein [Ceraceosorus guamensis]
MSRFAKDNASASLVSQRALVSGGTQGIGAGIALRFAQAGAEVYIIGRNKEKGEGVIKQLIAATEELKKRNGESIQVDAQHAFFKADLSDVGEIKRVIDEVQQRAGSKGIDWVVQCQGGPPNGRYVPTPQGRDFGWSVQVLSRFAIAHLLTQKKLVKRGLFFIAAPASGGSKPLDTDDLDFTKAHQQGTFKDGYLSIYYQGRRDSSQLDSVTLSLAERQPNLAVAHLFPGFVSTDASSNSKLPFPIPQISHFLGPWVGQKPGPGGYAEAPVHLAAHSEGQKFLRLGEGNFFNERLKRLEPSTNVREKSVREKVWSKLESYLQ